jgi:hypothetical protein
MKKLFTTISIAILFISCSQNEDINCEDLMRSAKEYHMSDILSLTKISSTGELRRKIDNYFFGLSCYQMGRECEEKRDSIDERYRNLLTLASSERQAELFKTEWHIKLITVCNE